ncbi:MAG: class I SAM-dependent methyltransferase [Acidimicrobiia bacterium]
MTEFDHGGESLTDAWDEQAAAWIRWARTPKHDDYYELYNLPRFLELLPAPGRLTLDLGAGEGRLGRVLRDQGHRVVGIEPSWTLAHAAHEATTEIPIACAHGGFVPIASGAADLVVCFMVLQDVDDLAGVVAEIARVLAPNGVACVAIVHPMVSSGFFDPEQPMLYVGRYLDVMRNTIEVQREEVPFTFHSAHRPLEHYSRAFEQAELVIEAVREPAFSDAHVEARPALERHRLLPNFLYFSLRHARRR